MKSCGLTQYVDMMLRLNDCRYRKHLNLIRFFGLFVCLTIVYCVQMLNSKDYVFCAKCISPTVNNKHYSYSFVFSFLYIVCNDC